MLWTKYPKLKGHLYWQAFKTLFSNKIYLYHINAFYNQYSENGYKKVNPEITNQNYEKHRYENNDASETKFTYIKQTLNFF